MPTNKFLLGCLVAVLSSLAALGQGSTVKINCHVSGKLYLDGKFLGAVVGGYQYPVHEVKQGRHEIRIVGTHGTWQQTFEVGGGETPVTPMIAKAPEPIKPEPVKPEPIKPEPVKPEPIKPEPIKPEPIKPEPVKPEPVIAKPTIETRVVLGLGLKLVKIKPGEFKMGSNRGQPNERPVHTVTISSEFWIGQTEVTLAQFKKILPRARVSGTGNDMPAAGMLWGDAVAFCDALTKREQGSLPPGYHYRLPTEAEWEYACRAGTSTEYFFGKSASEGTNYVPQGRKIAKVGSKQANPWGLYDMIGNVYEWTLDACDPRARGSAKTYRNGVVDPLELRGAGRIMRGGSYYLSLDKMRSATRWPRGPSRGTSQIGFRIVLAPVKQVPREGLRGRRRR